MFLYTFVVYLCLLVASTGAGSVSSFSPARPPAVPLAVKSPYLSTWLSAGSQGGNGGYLAGEWPTFWAGQIKGWAGMIRVDGNVYTWMGLPGSTTVNQSAFEYTSTKSVFTMHVGDQIQFNVTFLSPVTPDDFQWAAGDRNAIAQWDYGVTDNGVAYHKVWRQEQRVFNERADEAEWGDWYWATDNAASLTYQSGADADVRGTFTKSGKLANSKDVNYRAISSNWPVFGLTHDLGAVTDSASALFTIGLAQDAVIQYNGSANGIINEPPLWKSYFSTAMEALDFFHNDHEDSSTICADLDQKIADDSLSKAGQDYLTITSLIVRQAFGATQLAGTPSNPYLFMKEISSNGNMNTVDVVFPAYPIFLYTNPELLQLLLKPYYEIQESGKYPNKYAMHDIGSHYPNATGHGDGEDEKMPLEECGNMIIMALAYHQKANDSGAYLQAHYNILKQWAEYLIQDALYPSTQMSTDDFAGSLANQTNLALKGIIGIEAMAAISRILDHPEDAGDYSLTSHDYIARWQQLAVNQNANPPHTTLSYGNESSHGLLYNLYADRQLGLNLVPQSIYDMQDKFYPTLAQRYGIPLDTRASLTKGDWELFIAAIHSDGVRDTILKLITTWINETPTSTAITDLYDTINGNYADRVTHFIARPVVGGAFAMLLL
ncbi:hypothetical protein FE257_006888 [Aspergillus nanangensis]|uniref:Glutaminase GtaA n=1 Tax=Aspergillus nanangensis TaxID=2582783 RepID=A0AAD4GVT4_ASPNN|nr:hypothetical protein FE257_006888 [Aspergillus nanangensis]